MSLYQQILAFLSGAPTQDERLLQLRTPLGPEVLLAERLSLHEHIGPGPATPAGLRAEVHALAADAHIELKSLLGQPALLQLELADGRHRPWHGHITEAAMMGSDGGLARYRLVIEPWLAFLGQRVDSWVFLHQTVREIIEEVFADYAGAGRLAPAWRFDLADESVYAQRSLCIQYQESDLAFVQRLMLEEGLFAWWEHEAGSDDGALGRHTLVIADHNGALAPSAQPRVRFTQAGAALKEDSLTRWRTQTAVHTAHLTLSSQDYRRNGAQVALREVAQAGTGLPQGLDMLALADVPGLYAYEDPAQGERLALRHMQALDALRHTSRAWGTLRQAAPGRTFTLAEHPRHSGRSEDDRFTVLGVHHVARSNLSADLKAQVMSLLGAIRAELGAAANTQTMTLANDSDEPIYSCTLTALPASTPVRVAGAQVQEEAFGSPGPDIRLHPRPTVHGVQTALVVGVGEPVLTDRDHRIKVQFHWQRGANASHRLSHAAGSNAPASESSGTWVRVSEAWAGANWGSNFTPRVGQEVLVAFVGGDIDRPVVVGSLFNGHGQADAQGNQVMAGTAGATGNAAMWFPGTQAQGKLQGHRHAQVLAGHKSQELASSASGQGGYNQLVFDDSPGAGRIELSTTTAQTRLQLGHLLHQSDNQRLQARGHGADLATAAWGAVRAAQGLLISAHRRPDTARHIDPREPAAQLDQGRELLHTLAETAHKHQAKLATEPDVIGAKENEHAKQLPVGQGLWASARSLAGTDQRGELQGGEQAIGGVQSGAAAIGGGVGTVSAWTRPDLVLAAPAGIGLHTPAHHVASGGATLSFTAGQDIQHMAQAHHATAAKSGLVLFTYGKAANPNKPNQETGIALHAASGNVNLQSQSGATRLTADKAVEVASTTAMVRIAAPQHVLLTAAGAAVELKGGNITLMGPGKVEFRGGMKELGGGASAQPGLAGRRT